MFTFIGIIFGILCILGGYMMHGGSIGILIQPSEFIILLGAAGGIFLGSNGMKGAMTSIKAVMGILKPDPYTQQAYIELLKMMYKLFNVARKEGLLGLEKHIEKPEESEIINQYPSFVNNHHAVHFFCDTMKVILTGAVSAHDLSEMMEIDLETAHHESKLPAEAIQNVGDAMPAVGIVAAVLGIIITMGHVGGAASEIGHSVAAALVGTFLGIFIAYVICFPLARALTLRNEAEEPYLNCIRYALFSFARGESPITCVEFARRNIHPSLRPGFLEMENAVKEKEAA